MSRQLEPLNHEFTLRQKPWRTFIGVRIDSALPQTQKPQNLQQFWVRRHVPFFFFFDFGFLLPHQLSAFLPKSGQWWGGKLLGVGKGWGWVCVLQKTTHIWE